MTKVQPRAAQTALYLQCAEKIGLALVRDAFWDGPRCNWLGWSMEPVDRQWSNVWRACGSDLYGGTAGIALFLAELQQFVDDAQLRRTLHGALHQVISRLDVLQGAARCGFFSGVAGMAWVLLRAGHLLQHEGLIQRGLQEMSGLQDCAPEPHLLDVINGSAGLIPVLLAVAMQYDQTELVALAQRHGKHLLQLAQKNEMGWSWDTMQVKGQANLTGHSHGVAGVITALLELHAVTGESEFKHAALEGLRYETALFSAQHANWPDLRHNDAAISAQSSPIYNMAWCHGAPGIGLSRWRNLQLLAQDSQTCISLQRDLDAALMSTANSLRTPWQPGFGNFSLCHGAAGNAELMLLAAQRAGYEGYLAVADKVAQDGLQHYALLDMPWPCGVAGAGENPSLLLGLAGIGYFYLRLLAPQQVPSILLICPEAKA